MTSSVNDLSDSSGPNEQQKESQPVAQNQTPPNGSFQPGMPPSSLYMIPRGQVEEGHALAQTAYPYIDPYYGSMIAAYGGQAVMHPHMIGVLQPGVPLPTDAVEEPVYVNAKQYHGILRRRQSRAKAESENKLIKSRKPYLHESRHLHALKRARGCGGRFLNSKKKGGDQQEDEAQTGNHLSLENLCRENPQSAHVAESNKKENPSSGL
ncbi:nuclear transcription factor Y subunit A-7 isoform X1 [Asparagus officinalis]|nr:nuclear transcription factor Y subunit A-7 isoform X1 [Asparagus officinalis]XP_020268974.1 nuclear transcription factor Y subunit A-7 isoform X1 [Asparagus officinalis]XP_020268975.1 nuclear transcription factor Y subunit A-7 isoform X1 [Asparagus officinalis]XP_020268976.1 nuclear transcription factor Y subunit A-7 isoform X1 [Asparagus officinalis]